MIALYLESFGNPRKFARIARRVTARKPIIAVKAGRSTAGARAAASHTASLAAKDVAVDALFRQAGVVRTDTIEELFDAVRLFAHQPVPAGARVAIVTNAGGFGILCADACEAAALEVAPLAEATRARLATLLPADASLANPVDVLAATSPASYAQALLALHDDPGVDAVVALYAPTLLTGPDVIADAIGRAWPTGSGKPLLACLIGTRDEPAALSAGRGESRIPCFAFPESAARALGHAARLAAHRRRPRGEVVRFADVDLAAIGAMCQRALDDADDAWLAPDVVRNILAAAGIRQPRSAPASSATAAGAAFRELQVPSAVLKIVAGGVLHKSEVDGHPARRDVGARGGGRVRRHPRRRDQARCRRPVRRRRGRGGDRARHRMPGRRHRRPRVRPAGRLRHRWHRDRAGGRRRLPDHARHRHRRRRAARHPARAPPARRLPRAARRRPNRCP